MPSDISTPMVPKEGEIKDLVRRIADAVNNILRGKTNNTGEVTLTANTTTTTLEDIRIGINSVLTLQPTTANAATAKANVYFGSPGDGSVTLTHANNAQTDRTFKYAIHG